MSLMTIVIWCAVLLACVGAILWAYMNVRARRIVSRLGAFRCWSRPDVHSGWTAGIGVYGVEDLRSRVGAWRFRPRSRTLRTVPSSKCAWRMVTIVTRWPWNA